MTDVGSEPARQRNRSTWFCANPPPLNAGSGPWAAAPPASAPEATSRKVVAAASRRDRLRVVIAGPHRAGRSNHPGRGGAASGRSVGSDGSRPSCASRTQPAGRLVAASARTEDGWRRRSSGTEPRSRAPSPLGATDRSRRSVPEPASWTSRAPSAVGMTTAKSGGRREQPAIAGPQVGRDDRAGESPAGRVGHREVAIEPDDRPEVRVVEGHGRPAARRDDADAARELAARLDREPVARGIPGELGREGAPEPVRRAEADRGRWRAASLPSTRRRQMPRSARVARSTRIS